MKQKQVSFLARYALQAFAIILITGVLLRTFVFSSFVMSGFSMLPSIWPGDFLLAGKWGLTRLQRGDVVALRCPLGREQICLKRVIGLPGDRIEFHDGFLMVNQQIASLQPVTENVVSESVGRDTWLIWPSEEPPLGTEPIVVPPEQVYVLNDKRSVLDDSRTWGPVKRALVEAKVQRVWLSLDWFENGEVRTWPRVRWERMFRSIN